MHREKGKRLPESQALFRSNCEGFSAVPGEAERNHQAHDGISCRGYRFEGERNMIELDIKIEAGDLYDYMLRHSYNSSAGILGSALGAVMIIVALAQGQWIFLIGGLALLLYLPWILFIKSRQQILNNSTFKETLHYKLDDEGLTITQGGAEAKQGWGDMHKAVSTGRSIILYTSRVNATIFPKRQLGDQKMAVVEMISTHMPPAKVKIRG